MTRHPRAFWVEAVAELDAGAALADVARRRRINANTLKWWRSELRREERPIARLLPVVTAHLVARPIEIAVGRAVVRVEPGTDVTYVAALASALGSAC